MGDRSTSQGVVERGGFCNDDHHVPSLRRREIGKVVDGVVPVELDGMEDDVGAPELDTHEHGRALAEGVEAPRRKGPENGRIGR